MSETEIHKGKLKKYDGDVHHKLIALILEHANSAPEDISSESLEGSMEFFRADIPYDECGFILINEVLYEIVEHEQFDDFYANEAVENSDGTISFLSIFYNGGTYLAEMLEESIASIKPTK